MMRSASRVMVFALLLAALTPLGGVRAQGPTPAAPTLLSAFFGLDNKLPTAAAGLCLRAPGQDGMPVIFSAVIDPDSLQPQDFTVTTQSGVVHTPLCATLSPAVDRGELRTVLLIGEFGDAEKDPPAKVAVVGDILTSAGKGRNPDAADENSQNFKGASVAVTPLSAGPTLIVAESVPQDQWELNQRSGRQRGDGCPATGTVQIVRATWAGGVSIQSGDEAGQAEGALYRVTLIGADGKPVEVAPFKLADLGDGDNNHLLCLDVAGEPQSVFFPAGYLYDPNADAPNPDTRVPVGAKAQTAIQLAAAYAHPAFAPTYSAWAELTAHPAYETGKIFYLEIVALSKEATARAGYDAYLAALSPAIEQVGGEIVLVYDLAMPGTGDLLRLEGDTYRDGVAYAARFPSRRAMAEVFLSAPVVAALPARYAALTNAQMMLGTDRLPALIANMPKDIDAATIKTPLVEGKTTDELIQQLLGIYPADGADPTEPQLRELMGRPDYATAPVYYINLYDWGSHGSEGAAAHDAYNNAAQNLVFAHGVRVYARVDIEQVLVGPYGWDRLILPRWPSVKVFTNLRLEPDYFEAQRNRVRSADVYGNYIATVRK